MTDNMYSSSNEEVFTILKPVTKVLIVCYLSPIQYLQFGTYLHFLQARSIQIMTINTYSSSVIRAKSTASFLNVIPFDSYSYLMSFWNDSIWQCLQVNKWDDYIFSAVQNERDRISTRRNTFDGCNIPSISTLSQAETLSRQVLSSTTKLFADLRTIFSKGKYF